MAQLIISASQLTQKKDELTALKNSFQKLVTRLESDANKLDSMWEGDAKNKFKTAMFVDITKLKFFIEVLIEFISILGTIIELYKQIEKKNAAIASS